MALNTAQNIREILSTSTYPLVSIDIDRDIVT